MRIAFPTNDKTTVAKRTGRCNEFAIYNIENNKIELIEYRDNTHEHHDHSHAEGEDNHSHSEIMETLKDIDLLTVIMVGKNFKKDLNSYSINYEMTKEHDIDTILNSYIK